MKNLVLVFASILFFGVFSSNSINAQEKTSEVKVINESNFNAMTKSGLVLVDFYADWCRPCKMMKPVLDEVATEYKSQITIAQINTDFNKNISAKYNITGIPCMILFENGKEVKRIVGYHDKVQFLSKLSSHIKLNN